MKKKIINIVVILLISACMLMVGVKAGTTILSSTVTYKDTTVEAALDELIDIANQCPNGNNYLCNRDIKLGDYMQSYAFVSRPAPIIPASLTGYDTEQTINLNELDLWRVININVDGSVDVVSEYASSTEVYFKGATGYQNLVGTLNYIASQYAPYVYGSKGRLGSGIKSRHMGYDGQFLTLPTNFIYSTAGSNTTGDDKDVELVKTAIGTLAAYKAGTTDYANYWVPSRNYIDGQLTIGLIHGPQGTGPAQLSSLGTSTTSNAVGLSIRPILTLPADTYISGDEGSGTKENPWIID